MDSNDQDNARIAIARHLNLPSIFAWIGDIKVISCDVPDYCNDYYAIMPLIHNLTNREKVTFVHHLLDVLNIRDDQTPEPLEMFAFATAGADKLTEAYALTKGLL